MIIRWVCALLFICSSILVHGQTCIYSDLSSKFDFEVSIARKPGEQVSSGIITVTVRNKVSKRNIQTILLHAAFLFSDAFSNCTSVRSYVTGKNKNAGIADNDFGDFIIADFNFDSRDDMAIKKNSGGNGGPLYDYYLQDTSGKFIRNAFLSDNMEYFPVTISKGKKQLVTYIHAGVCGLGEHVYDYNTAASTWREKSHRIINICNNKAR